MLRVLQVRYNDTVHCASRSNSYNSRELNNNNIERLFLGLGQSSEKLEMFKQNFDKVQSEALASAAEDGLQDWLRDRYLLVRIVNFVSLIVFIFQLLDCAWRRILRKRSLCLWKKEARGMLKNPPNL